MTFNKVTIIGVGLIGGSLAKVLKARGMAREIHGAGRSRETLELALRLGVIDHMGQDSVRAVEQADLVVLATPVGTFEPIVRDIGPHLKTGAILTDVGSVKGGLVRTVEQLLPAGVHYVPAHPIAGREKHGVAESVETLFQNARCIVTPTERTDRTALDAVKSLWQAAGATIVEMSPESHDHVFAAVSHLPHVAAYAMMCSVSELNAGEDQYIDFSGAGFRDFTRIAASSPEMWRDICLANAKNVVDMIDRYQFVLSRMKKAIHRGDRAKIERLFKQASDARRGMQ
ncbi:MAG: prephenate dehydrogenase/arogenate dehydrogenase family protein [Nitrospiraceae bacterium]|nr:prephenate dehydrogenase/arogenate dehydrogenase family protein [Nitrospiraceae bacterium]